MNYQLPFGNHTLQPKSGAPLCEITNRKLFHCGLCTVAKCAFLGACGCYYCLECWRDSCSAATNDTACIICQQPRQVSYDLRDKKQLMAITEAEQLQRVVRVVKFCAMHNSKYVEKLEKKLARMQVMPHTAKMAVVDFKPTKRLEQRHRALDRVEKNRAMSAEARRV